jgi:hypothetical protein
MTRSLVNSGLLTRGVSVSLSVSLAVACALMAGCGSGGNSNDNPAPVPSSAAVSSLSVSSAVSSAVTSTSTITSTSTSTSSSAVSSAPADYAFTREGVSTVSYTGQVARQVMIEEIKTYIGKIGKLGEPSVAADLNRLFENPGLSLDTQSFSLKAGSLPVLQTTFGSLSTNKNLIDKIAGGYQVDGVNKGETTRLLSPLVGVDIAQPEPKPADVVRAWFDDLQTLASITTPDPLIPVAAGGTVPVSKAYVNASGVDYQQLVQKFLLMSVGFSQGVNDYLVSDFNSLFKPDGTNPYTQAEHFFDEAFGYFGATPDYGRRTDTELAAAYFDTNQDSKIDLKSEYVFATAGNCAKRDLGASAAEVALDLSGDTFKALVAGRQILADVAASQATQLTPAQETALKQAIRDAARGWEACIAATVVHYVNKVLADTARFKDGRYVDEAHYLGLAKNWSEMKGFALGLQFSPFSPFRKADDTSRYAELTFNYGGQNLTADLPALYGWMGNGPALADDVPTAIVTYTENLKKARSLLQAAYNFDQDLVLVW